MSRQLSALSGLAMLLIIANHTVHMGLDGYQQLGTSTPQGAAHLLLVAIQALGAFAVPLFMFISGSFITYAARGQSSLSPRFIWGSLKHILVPYLLWSLLFYLLLALFHQARYSPAGYARNLLVGYPFHFIPLLTVCYLLSPVLVSVGRRHGWLMLGAIGLYQLFLIVLGEPARYGLPSDTPLRLLVPPVLGTTLTSWAIYFPLGVVFSLHAATLRPHLQRWWPLFAVATVLLFGTGLLDAFQYIDAPFARHLCPVTLLLVVPVIERNRIPWVRRLEQIGKRSYGLYLTHLIVLDLSVLAIMAFIPWLFSTPALLFPLLYVVALQVPLQIMEWMARKPIQKNYRYVFG